jgi:hypothetical protein
MKCGLCHTDVEKLSKSHIIPRALHLFGQEKGEHQGLLVMPVDKGKRVERSHTGFHSRIVCADCEASFKAGDDALIELSRTHADAVQLFDELGATEAFQFPNINNGTLHRGVIATLFRANLSDNDFYKQVDLPPRFAEQLRQVLLSPEPSHHSDFDVVLRLTPSLHGSVIKSPRRLRFCDVNTYWLTFPYWTAAIKVDGQKSRLLRQVRIGAYGHPVAALTPELNPSELKALSKAMRGKHEDVLRITAGKFEKINRS